MSTENTLRAFCRHAGPIRLLQVTPQSVAAFLDNGVAEVTRCSRFSGVKCFLEYFTARGSIPPLCLVPPAKPRQTRAPFIFTNGQIKAMLAAADRCQHRAFDLDGKTLRMVVLLLYGTGATLDEVLSLRLTDFDKKKRTLRLAGTTSRPQRSLPIGKPLSEQLSTFLSAKIAQVKATDGALLLSSMSGKPIGRGHLCARFKKLQRMAGIEGSGRLQDLRFTFAVHRLKEWIATKKNLTKLMPAMSSYMGYASLMKAEDFLAFTPERFHGDLRKLIRDDGAPKWTRDKDVLRFLAGL